MTENLNIYTVKKLKEMLRERGLPVSGNKAFLIKRLEESMDKQFTTIKELNVSHNLPVLPQNLPVLPQNLQIPSYMYSSSKPDTRPSLLPYVHKYPNVQNALKRINEKVKQYQMLEIEVYTLYTPHDLFHLLYGRGNGNHDNFGVILLGDGDGLYEIPHVEKFENVYNTMEMIILVLDESLEGYIELTYESLIEENSLDTYIEYMKTLYPTFSDNKLINMAQTWPEDYVNIMKKYKDYTDVPSIKQMIKNKTNNFILFASENSFEKISKEELKLLEFTDADIDAVILIHTMILDGKLKVTALYNPMVSDPINTPGKPVIKSI